MYLNVLYNKLENTINMMNKKTINIVFEGLDGSGKSTLSKLLYSNLKDRFNSDLYNINYYNNPHSEICKEERDYLLNNNLSSEEEVDLFLKCKNKLINLINKNNSESKININIIDRWIYSTIVYQNIKNVNYPSQVYSSNITDSILFDNSINTFDIDIVVLLSLKSYDIFKEHMLLRNKMDEKEMLLNSINKYYLAHNIYKNIINNNVFDIHKYSVHCKLNTKDTNQMLLYIINKIIGVVV